MSKPVVTILIPHYKTLELTRLCLELIRKQSDESKIRVIVIDNGSNDASLDYLRSLSSITLVEREPVPCEGAISAHARALDLGLQQVNTRLVLSIHTDTLIKHPGWLDFLIAQIDRRPTIAGVGSWKLEEKPLWRQVLKVIERSAQLMASHLTGQAHAIEGRGRNYYYLRSHCAMYRMDLIRKFDLTFAGNNMVAGKDMHGKLVEAGYEMIFLSSEVLIQYLDHINHATSILNPELSHRMKSSRRGLQRVQKILDSFQSEYSNPMRSK